MSIEKQRNRENSDSPPVPAGPIVSLVYRTTPEKRTALIEFLNGALPLYERPGGIQIALYESIDEPCLFFELVAYESEAAFEADQLRVEQDQEMKAVLEEWHQLIDGPLEVKRMRPVQLTRQLQTS
jgi:quinol monooxygenase YgiN